MSNVYLAFYKGRKKVTGFKSALYRFIDWVIRSSTKGEFSHVEVAIKRGDDFDCYSSSTTDGGVRLKRMSLAPEKWTLKPIQIDEGKIHDYYLKTKHQKYDFLGAIASTIPFVQLKNLQFCSEWCFNAIKGGDSGWRFSPNDLYEMHK